MKRSRRNNNSNNIYYGETSEGEDGFLSTPAAARARNAGKLTPGTRSSSKSDGRTRSSSQTTHEPLTPPSKQLQSIKDIREALALSQSSGRGIPSSKDQSEKVLLQFSHEQIHD